MNSLTQLLENAFNESLINFNYNGKDAFILHKNTVSDTIHELNAGIPYIGLFNKLKFKYIEEEKQAYSELFQTYLGEIYKELIKEILYGGNEYKQELVTYIENLQKQNEKYKFTHAITYQVYCVIKFFITLFDKYFYNCPIDKQYIKLRFNEYFSDKNVNKNVIIERKGNNYIVTLNKDPKYLPDDFNEIIFDASKILKPSIKEESNKYTITF